MANAMGYVANYDGKANVSLLVIGFGRKATIMKASQKNWAMLFLMQIDVPQWLLIHKLATERQTFRAIAGSSDIFSTGGLCHPVSLQGWHIIGHVVWFPTGEE